MMLRSTTFLAVALCAATGCAPLADGDLGIDIHVTSISPAQVPSTGGARVTIVGTNLDDGVTVTFGGVPALAVQHVGAGVLDVVPPPHVVGSVDVEVSDPDGRTATVPHAVHYFAGTLAASPGTLFLPGPMPGPPVFGGDIDGDGIDDALAWQLDTPGWSAVLLDAAGRPRIGAQVPAQVAEDGTSPFGLRDVDGDGFADAITGIGIVLADRAGGWGDISIWPFTFALPMAAAFGDFDGDGITDVALMTVEGVRLVKWDVDRAKLMTERLGGAYVPRARSGNTPEQPVAGDFNADGKADLAWVGLDNKLRVALGPDLATVIDLGAAPAFHEQAGATFGTIAAIDVDWDNHVDLLAADATETRVYRGGVGAIATTPLSLPAACAPGSELAGVSVAARDVPVGATMAVRCGDVTRLTEPAPTEAGLQLVAFGDLRTVPRAPIALADLDGDGNIDVLEVTDNGARTWYSKFNGLVPYGTVRVTPSDNAETIGMTLATGNFGDSNHVVAAYGPRIEVVGNPFVQGAVAGEAEEPFTHMFEQLAACDIDGDGTDDVIAMTRVTNRLELRTVMVHASGLVVSRPFITTDDASARMVVGRSAMGCEAMLIHDGFTNVDAFDVRSDHAVQSELSMPQELAFDTRSFQLVDVDGDGALELYSPCANTPDADSRKPVVLRPKNGALVSTRPDVDPGATCGTHVELANEWGMAPRGDGTFTLWATAAGGIQGENFVTLATVRKGGAIDVVDQIAVPALGDVDGLTMTLGDIDGDGLVDAVASPPPGSTGGVVLVLTHPEEAGAQLALAIAVADGQGASPIQWNAFGVTDVDGDGFPDLLFGTGDYDDRLGVIRNESH